MCRGEKNCALELYSWSQLTTYAHISVYFLVLWYSRYSAVLTPNCTAQPYNIKKETPVQSTFCMGTVESAQKDVHVYQESVKLHTTYYISTQFF